METTALPPMLTQSVTISHTINNTTFVDHFFLITCITFHYVRYQYQQKKNGITDLLEIEVNNDIIQKFSIIQAVEIFISHCYSASSRRWRVCKQTVTTYMHHAAIRFIRNTDGQSRRDP